MREYFIGKIANLLHHAMGIAHLFELLEGFPRVVALMHGIGLCRKVESTLLLALSQKALTPGGETTAVRSELK